MHVNCRVHAGAAAALAILTAGPATAQNRGMMMPMPSPMPTATTMPRMMMPRPQVAVLIAQLRQREAVLGQMLNRVQAEINALAMTRPTSMRNATIMALQRQEVGLMMAIRQTAAQIAALGG